MAKMKYWNGTTWEILDAKDADTIDGKHFTDIQNDAQSKVDAHNSQTSVHGATSAATANTIIMRDSAGRAKVAAPSAADDIARKDTVDAVQANLNSHLAEKAKVHTASGTANALTITTGGNFALTDGNWIKFKAAYNNTGAVTLNVDGKGAKSLKNPDGTDLAAGDLEAGVAYEAFYSTDNGFFVLRPSGGAIVIEFENYTPPNPILVPKDDGGELIQFTCDELSVGRYSLAGASVGNYALFAGGNYYNAGRKEVDAYNASLIHTLPTELSVGRYSLAGASVGNYALFAGGSTDSGPVSTVDAYNTSLTRTSPTQLSSGRRELAGASVGDYALFAGGTTSTGFAYTVSAYNTSLVYSRTTDLTYRLARLAGASVGDYALFAGGNYNDNYGNFSNVVNAYNTSLTRTIPASLSQLKSDLAGASVGDYALFAGGRVDSYGSTSDVVDVYNTSLTRLTPIQLSTPRRNLASVSMRNYALFGGGSYSSSSTNIVDVYDTSLTRTNVVPLSRSREDLAGASVGNCALFGGGSPYSAVDAYGAMAQGFYLHVPIGTKYKFGEEELTATNTEIPVYVPATGYVKYKKGIITN